MPDIASDRAKEFRRLRRFMVVPGYVDVLHSNGGRDVWLTDEIVLVNVTGSPAVDGLEDGGYRLQANNGLVPRGALPRVNLPIYFDRVRKLEMHPVCPTGLSFTGNAAKAMLVFAEIPWSHVKAATIGTASLGKEGVRYPLAMNEDVWSAFVASYPDATLWHAGHAGPFLIGTKDRPELAYVEPVKIPVEMQPVAIAAIDAAEWPKGDDDDKDE